MSDNKFSQHLQTMAESFKDEEAKRELAGIDQVAKSGDTDRAWMLIDAYQRKYYPNPPFQDKYKLANIASAIKSYLERAERKKK